MKLNKILFGMLSLFFATGYFACEQMDDEGLPITNDLRVLQVRINDNITASGADNISVLSELQLVLSHPLNTGSFEGALSISPEVAYSVSYDNTNSLATISFENPLDYETTYTIDLPQGGYGANGEASLDDFTYSFTTAPFEAPSVMLSTDAEANSFFEGETISITATIDRAILETVTMDIVFSGVAVEGTDFTASATSITIDPGNTSGSIEVTATGDGEIEGEESITVNVENLMNAVIADSEQLDLTLGDLPPAIELKGVMSLKIGGTDNNGRAVHLIATEDIADLSIYGIGIANNGGGSDGREIDFPAISVASGDHILLVRDIDEAGMAAYFGDCFNDFDHVIPSDGVNFNGDDPFELYNGNTVIETYGDVELDGTGLEWEWTGAWAYKLNGVWEYAEVDCSANSTAVLEADCVYPFCMPIQLQGILALLWDGSGTNGGKAVHLRANRAIADISVYGLGVANNGGGTDGVEFNLPVMSVEEGDHILVAREPETLASYFGACYDGFDLVIQSDAMNQNGDDAIELFNGMDVIETFGDADVDGTGEFWEYSGSWGYKSGGVFVYGGVDCAAGSTSTQSSACPYVFCE